MDASFVLLLVADPARSATFYAKLLGRAPFEQLLEPFLNRPANDQPPDAAPVRITAYFLPEPQASTPQRR